MQAPSSEKLEDVIVIACPGQGSQTPGFFQAWLEDPSAREFLGNASEAVGIDLIAHGTTSDADTIRDTAIAQPLIVAASLLAWRALSSAARDAGHDLARAGVAGHSVGEFAAAAISGVMTDTEALTLVGVRGRAMAAAAAGADTGMAAVVGGVEAQVLEKIVEHGLTPANRNGGGQIVAAGTKTALESLAGDAPRAARVIPLQVAGAFHTEYMASAVPELAEAASYITPRDPHMKLWTNADGSEVTSGETFVKLLVDQVANPVRWDACMESFQAAGISGLIELTPSGALTGIARRGLKGVPTVGIASPDDLSTAIQLLADTAA